MTNSSTLASMTGFARTDGTQGATSWAWELRSVNGRGLEIKLRLGSGLEALEFPLRDIAAKIFKRGNISGTLTLKRDAVSSITADMAALEQVKELAIALADSIPGALPPRAELLMALPGVMRSRSAEPEPDESAKAELTAAITAGFEAALTALAAARAEEGQKLAAIAAAHLEDITSLVAQARLDAGAQPALHKAKLTAQLAELLGPATPLPEERLAQELALLATKSDVREELDRLSAHITAARGLLGTGGPMGRQLDFLMQEFNREANTLCSKSASLSLTAIGLSLKAAIEQLREQVQNIE